MDTVYDVIVVGAGIEGSATAYQLAKNGQLTLLLEQFPLPHSRGSSHGQSRVTRKAYGDMEHFTVMMKDAFPMWDQLEKETGKELYKQTGMLTMGLPEDPFVSGSIKALQRHNIPHEVLDSTQSRKRFPMLSFPESYVFVLDHSGGILRADKALQAYQDQFQKYGGKLNDGEGLTNIFPGDIITVQTTKKRYRCRNIVLTVGPWAKQLLPTLGVNLPLQVQRISVLYWKENNPGEYGAENFPVFYQTNAIGKYSTYGLPSEEYPGLVKICLHWGPDVDPNTRDKADDSWVITTISKFVLECFPGLVPVPAVAESCIYTWTPDENFILDRHPKWKNIIIGAGFSGHGFKLAPAVGKALSELAMNKQPTYNMDHFKIGRFYSKAKM